MRLGYLTPSQLQVNVKDPSRIRLKSCYDDNEADPLGGESASHHPSSPQADVYPNMEELLPGGFEIGSAIDGQYRIEELHKGGMGVVYIVTDLFSEVKYAVKTLRDELRENQEASIRFMSEAKTWIRLGHHPHIVQAMYYREVAGYPLLFLEYVDGTNLEEVYSRPGPGPAMQHLLDWVIQISEGLHFANTRDLGEGSIGLVHRDIKPGNIMLTKSGIAKITDFGLAKVTAASNNLTRDKVGMGTLRYMAPEQVRDAKHVDVRADIYSVGAVFYEGLVGHPPFTQEDSISLYHAVLTTVPPRLRTIRETIPEELDRIIMRCLQKERDQRYANFEELCWVLRRFKERHMIGNTGSHLRLVT
jgi:serine/threonine-protein kinase